MEENHGTSKLQGRLRVGPPVPPTPAPTSYGSSFSFFLFGTSSFGRRWTGPGCTTVVPFPCRRKGRVPGPLFVYDLSPR